MTDTRAPEEGIAAFPSNDHRPNSGLREGAIPHAQVNESIRLAAKTIVFGQQNRLRNGLLMEDDLLPRFHAGHDLVKFFYGGIRQIPEYLLDAILAAGISVTLVMDRDLLSFEHVRQHQSCHVGYTRKTIYMPETVLTAAQAKGYDYWAISEIIIQEAWPLLDYLLILELIRRAQVRLHERISLGYYFIKDTLRALNQHRQEVAENEENEFTLFYRRYADDFHSWTRSILDRDPYEMVDEIFDEYLERIWAEWKIDAITYAYSYPTYFSLDRDIVHPAAYELAEIQGLPLAPETVEEIIHDLCDVARFKISRQIKTDPLLDQLIDAGGPGIEALAEAAAEEKATRRNFITADQHDGYATLAVFKKKLQQHSNTPNEGLPGSISNDFNQLYDLTLLEKVHAELKRFRTLPERDQVDSRDHLKELLFTIVGICRPDLDELQKQEMIDTPEHWIPAQELGKWLDLADHLLANVPPQETQTLLATILEKLDRHPLYHTLFREQARQLLDAPDLSWGIDIRDQIDFLFNLIPEQPYRLSSDPQALQNRLLKLQQLRRSRPDAEEQFELIAGIILRLDKADDYAELLEKLEPLKDRIEPTLRELVDGISHRDTRRQAIRQTARALLQTESVSQPVQQQSAPTEILSRLSDEGIVRIFYRLVGDDPSPEQVENDRALYAELSAAGHSPEEIVRAIKWTVENVPGVRKFNMVKLCIAEALAQD